MVRLTRAQQQERTRAAVLTAARAEFTERGYAAAKVDKIAERAELTRGAVYSNFPGKRALYLAVLLDLVEHGASEPAATTAPPSPTAPSPAPLSSAEALGAFARSWLEQLPLAGDAAAFGPVQLRSLSGVLDDEPIRTAFGQVTRLESLLLALALESRAPEGAAPARQVRRAELVLRLLDGPGASVDPALVFGDPFDVAQACAHLGTLALADTWDPAYLPYIPPARVCHEPWNPPEKLRDLITGRAVGFDEDGLVVVLGSHRLEAAEEAVRAAQDGDRVTVAVATGDPAEIGRLVQLRIGDFTRCLRRVFGPEVRPRLRIVLDDSGLLASAVGVTDADDTSEHAVRVRQGALIARARGRGAAHAAATVGRTTSGISHTSRDGASR
ncbi:helix-turn-helix domain-containing protein [Streptomyces sp. NPDC041068]|uniref:TetR/AcrR family transcriptional regulator n=1 Tax=Streptomyces sp. NPDC041068 TaxID=3155130 RepID=UPI0033D9EDB1